MTEEQKKLYHKLNKELILEGEAVLAMHIDGITLYSTEVELNDFTQFLLGKKDW